MNQEGGRRERTASSLSIVRHKNLNISTISYRILVIYLYRCKTYRSLLPSSSLSNLIWPYIFLSYLSGRLGGVLAILLSLSDFAPGCVISTNRRRLARECRLHLVSTARTCFSSLPPSITSPHPQTQSTRSYTCFMHLHCKLVCPALPASKYLLSPIQLASFPPAGCLRCMLSSIIMCTVHVLNSCCWHRSTTTSRRQRNLFVTCLSGVRRMRIEYRKALNL